MFLFLVFVYVYKLRRAYERILKLMRMDRKTMKSVDMSKEFTSFTPSDQYYIKKFEELNSGRASSMKHLRTRNKRIGLLMGGIVLGICILSSLNTVTNINKWSRTSYMFVHRSSLRSLDFSLPRPFPGAKVPGARFTKNLKTILGLS